MSSEQPQSHERQGPERPLPRTPSGPPEHPIYQRIVDAGAGVQPLVLDVGFQFVGGDPWFAPLAGLRGQKGWLVCMRLTVAALEVEEHLCLYGVIEGGGAPFDLDHEQCRRLLDLPAVIGSPRAAPSNAACCALLATALADRRQSLLRDAPNESEYVFDRGNWELDRLQEEHRSTLEAALLRIDRAIEDSKKAARLAHDSQERAKHRAAVAVLECQRLEAKSAYEMGRRDIERRRDAVEAAASRRAAPALREEHLFTLRWSLS